MRIKDISFCGQTLYCYSLRIDVKVSLAYEYNEDGPCDVIGPDWTFFDNAANYIRTHFKYSIIGREISDNGKTHLQCFCCHDVKLGEKTLLNMRHYIKTHIADDSRKQPVSLKKSWSPLGLFTYCQKDGNVKICMPDELYHHLEKLAEAKSRPPREQVLHSVCQRAQSLKHLVRLLCEQVQLGALHCVPRKTEVWKIALRSGLIDFDTYYAEFYSPRI